MRHTHGDGRRLTIVGGGLAGSEAALAAADRGIPVRLYEMRPGKQSPAHRTPDLAELVCSNSLGSNLPDRAGGLLKAELRRLGSRVLAAADLTAVPAGGALAVDRDAFAAMVTQAIQSHPGIELVREEVSEIPSGPTVIASGPLTSAKLADSLGRVTGREYLYFYDALAPIVTADSIDMGVAFRASRYGKGETEEGDYINCPLDEAQYTRLVTELVAAPRIELRDFEREDEQFFEGCLPVEVIASRGPRSLAFGPMRPVGLRNPHTGRRPFAVVQLRQDDLAGSLYNIVGFQTNIKWPEQRQILRLIPGLDNAEFVRLGQMHRNTFLNSPRLLRPTMQLTERDDLFFAGQITGIEGYTGNIAGGLVAGVNAARLLGGLPPLVPPPSTMTGALCHYVTHSDADHFQPMKANFGLLPELDRPVRGKRERKLAYSSRALEALDAFLQETEWLSVPEPA